ncbi:MAG: phenylalanine--tRNA ligase subunit beta [Candidatus Levybacteria bacterium]|nr:phenylalanine--tRNA ligase subunit beta [Candidatus Levybacteria bacterium]
MVAPLSWLKEYVDITLSPEKLGEKLTEVGLGTEKITKIDNDIFFEFEITPNRPDLLSIIGIAREIAAIEARQIKYPETRIDIKNIKPKKSLPLNIQTESTINPRFTGIIVDGIKVKDSPKWLSEKLIKIGQRPINNIVDITNYVMFELGNPIHAFDYERINGKVMKVHQAKGGEKFKSVDGLSYYLPKGAVIISDRENIIDLCGIKGGFNSGTFENTKTIFIRVPVEVPVLIRRASQSLGLRSEASSIFERGVNAGGTPEALERCLDLILEIAGGEISSSIFDIKKEDFAPWVVNLSYERLNKILGITIKKEIVLNILKKLNLSPKDTGKDLIKVVIPTYRNDLKIEEDLIEEVARLYGYNNFPKTIPEGEIPTKTILYFKNYLIDEKVKNLLKADGFSEIYSYSLISEKDLVNLNINSDKVLRVDNPVSREFEYLRPTLKINLLKAFVQNKPNFEKINLFEMGKVYLGPTLDEANELYMLSGISNEKNFYEIKGLLERIFEELNIDEDPSRFIDVTRDGVIFELNFSDILEKTKLERVYKPIPKYPPVVEDITIEISGIAKTGEIINEIKKQSTIIESVELKDMFKNNRTFHIIYQHRERNLTNEEVGKIREKIIEAVQQKFKAKVV